MNKYQRELKKYEGKEPTLVTDEGTRYYGKVLNGKANGKGTQITKDGVLNKGHWINGQMNGKGIHYYTNGAYFIGSFTNKGHYHGKGAEYTAEGKVLLRGIWDNGKYVGNSRLSPEEKQQRQQRANEKFLKSQAALQRSKNSFSISAAKLRGDLKTHYDKDGNVSGYTKNKEWWNK